MNIKIICAVSVFPIFEVEKSIYCGEDTLYLIGDEFNLVSVRDFENDVYSNRVKNILRFFGIKPTKVKIRGYYERHNIGQDSTTKH